MLLQSSWVFTDKIAGGEAGGDRKTLESFPTGLKTDDAAGMADDQGFALNLYGDAKNPMPAPKSVSKFLGFIFVALTDIKTGFDPLVGRRVHRGADFSMVVR